MKLAIMQPYFFPYIGYFQLIHSVDKFVIYDDVNFIKSGWINRNFILAENGKLLCTMKLSKASSFAVINSIEIIDNFEKLLKTIQYSYQRAPYFDRVFPMLKDILNYGNKNLAIFNSNAIKVISKYIRINTEILISSNYEKKDGLKGQERVVDLCKRLGANQYINPIGGSNLYESTFFSKNSIELSFLRSRLDTYDQRRKEFIPNLSIIDVMMYNDPTKIEKMLKNFELI